MAEAFTLRAKRVCEKRALSTMRYISSVRKSNGRPPRGICPSVKSGVIVVSGNVTVVNTPPVAVAAVDIHIGASADHVGAPFVDPATAAERSRHIAAIAARVYNAIADTAGTNALSDGCSRTSSDVSDRGAAGGPDCSDPTAGTVASFGAAARPHVGYISPLVIIDGASVAPGRGPAASRWG